MLLRAQKEHTFPIDYVCSTRSYLDKCLKPLVLWVQIFEVIYCLIVMSAEFAVCFLHSLGTLPGELQDMRHRGALSSRCGIQAVPASLSKELDETKLVKSILNQASRSLENKELSLGLHWVHTYCKIWDSTHRAKKPTTKNIKTDKKEKEEGRKHKEK